MRTAYASLWLAWIVMFFAVELSAIFTGHTQYTLSDYVWRLERLGTSWTFLRYLVAAGCVWLAGHLVWGWWR